MEEKRDPIAEKEAEYYANRKLKRPFNPEVGKLYQVAVKGFDSWTLFAMVLGDSKTKILDYIELAPGDLVHIVSSEDGNSSSFIEVVIPCGKIAWVSSAYLEVNPVEE